MRIASTQYQTTMNAALQDASARLEVVMQQMASGLRMQRPSDDPVNSVRVSRLAREEAALDQYRSNIKALGSRLQQNEAAMDGMVADMTQARDLLVWAADGGNASQDVQAMATQLGALRDSLFYNVNSKDQEGRYLFSGTVTATPAIAFDANAAVGARYRFTGNTAVQRVVVGNGITQAANVTMQDMAAQLNRMDRTVTTLAAAGVNPNDPVVQGQVRADLDGTDQTLDAINTQTATLGGAQRLLDTLLDNHANVSLSNKQSLISLAQLDYGDSAVKFNDFTMAVRATQKAYARVSALSLFDVMA